MTAPRISVRLLGGGFVTSTSWNGGRGGAVFGRSNRCRHHDARARPPRSDFDSRPRQAVFGAETTLQRDQRVPLDSEAWGP